MKSKTSAMRDKEKNMLNLIQYGEPLKYQGRNHEVR